MSGWGMVYLARGPEEPLQTAHQKAECCLLKYKPTPRCKIMMWTNNLIIGNKRVVFPTFGLHIFVNFKVAKNKCFCLFVIFKINIII